MFDYEITFMDVTLLKGLLKKFYKTEYETIRIKADDGFDAMAKVKKMYPKKTVSQIKKVEG